MARTVKKNLSSMLVVLKCSAKFENHRHLQNLYFLILLFWCWCRPYKTSDRYLQKVISFIKKHCLKRTSFLKWNHHLDTENCIDDLTVESLLVDLGGKNIFLPFKGNLNESFTYNKHLRPEYLIFKGSNKQ